MSRQSCRLSAVNTMGETLRAASQWATSPKMSKREGEDLQVGTPREVWSFSKSQTSENRDHGQVPLREIIAKRTTVRVLIADDHSIVRHGVTAWLHTHIGFDIVGQAESAKEALAQAILLKPDIVLMDVGLPEEGGVCATSQTVRTCLETKVVAFSASADPVHVRGMLAAGAMGYVLKASTPSTVLSAIRAVLSNSRFLDPGLSDSVIEELYIFPEVSRRTRDVLTLRETQVLERIVWGRTNTEIAFELDIKSTSVNTYRHRFCEKLGLKTRAEIVRYGIAVGLMKAHPPDRRFPGFVDLAFPAGNRIKFRQ
jgi:DNA-binding NarL/FixJ family response regulator